MTGYVTDPAGALIRLPAPLSWTFSYTCGVPCDSFRVRCLWDRGSALSPQTWVGFQAWEGTERVFTGLVDECEMVLSGQGSFLEVTGRGMAARLLDNEALGQDYQAATPQDILRDHVTPYGIQVARMEGLGTVSPFSVATGSSEWSVLYEFARYYNQISPRFDREGRLVLAPWDSGRTVLLDESVPVTQMVCRDKRYGVLSQVVVRDRYQGLTQQVDNASFQALGGQRRQVITMPGRSQYQAMRYSGQFQLDRSAAEQLRLEVTVAVPFFAQPGDLVQVQRGGWPRTGTFRVAQAQVGMDEDGSWTLLELGPPDQID